MHITKQMIYEERAKQLMLQEPARTAYIVLNQHADSEGTCPSCGAAVSRYEYDRVSHARLCKDLLADVASEGAR